MAEADATRACVVCGNALTSKMDKKCCGAECSAEHRRRAVAYYEKLNGFVQQSPLSFGMAA